MFRVVSAVFGIVASVAIRSAARESALAEGMAIAVLFAGMYPLSKPFCKDDPPWRYWAGVALAAVLATLTTMVGRRVIDPLF